MPITSNIGGPLFLGNNLTTKVDGTLPNIGTPILEQSFSISAVASTVTTATSVVNYQVQIPPNSTITGFTFDLITAWNSNTSANLKIGTNSGGTDYVSSQDLKALTPGRVSITYTPAQLSSMYNVGTFTTVMATVASTGTTSAGFGTIQVQYIQGS